MPHPVLTGHAVCLVQVLLAPAEEVDATFEALTGGEDAALLARVREAKGITPAVPVAAPAPRHARPSQRRVLGVMHDWRAERIDGILETSLRPPAEQLRSKVITLITQQAPRLRVRAAKNALNRPVRAANPAVPLG